jgi:hypothetical protein
MVLKFFRNALLLALMAVPGFAGDKAIVAHWANNSTSDWSVLLVENDESGQSRVGNLRFFASDARDKKPDQLGWVGDSFTLKKGATCTVEFMPEYGDLYVTFWLMDKNQDWIKVRGQLNKKIIGQNTVPLELRTLSSPSMDKVQAQQTLSLNAPDGNLILSRATVTGKP